MDLKVNNTKPLTFTAIKYNMAKDLLLSRLNDKQWDEFMSIVESQKDNPVDVVLFGDRSAGRLSGMVSYIDEFNGFAKQHSQNLFFESPLRFIKRMVRYADEEKTKLERMWE